MRRQIRIMTPDLCLCLLFIAISVSAPEASGQSVVYVDRNATGPVRDGSTWCGAYVHLQDALSAATASGGTVTEIRVGQGAYRPDRDSANPGGTGTRSATFQLLNGVALKGGYAGCGAPDPDVRNFDIYDAVLSGDLSGDDAPVACTLDSPDCDSNGGLCTDNWFCVISNNNGENSYHVVTGSETDATALIDGFTVTGGHADGDTWQQDGSGMFNNNGSPTVTNCTFTGNSALWGGGMYNINNSSPTVTDCTFTGNAAEFGGGGIINRSNSNPTVADCMFVENTGNSGAGMYNADSSPIVTNCTFSGNSFSWFGGGMSNENNSNPTVTNCTFSGNSPSLGLPGTGGGMANYISSPTVTDCAFTGNSASWIGGGMDNYESNPTVTNCTFVGNSAALLGGGMSTSFGSPTVINCTFSLNTATSAGGGMRTGTNSNATVIACLFTGNLSGGGGAMSLGGGEGVMITDCAFTGNTASNTGGAISASVSNATITNCAFSENTAFEGGGMNNSQFSSITVANCTFTGNHAANRGGGMFNGSDSSPTITNCTFNGNTTTVTGSTGGGMANFGSGTSVTNSIFWNNIPDPILSNLPIIVSYSNIQGGWSGAGNIDAIPLFTDIANGNFRLLPGSLSINMGNNTVVTTLLDLDHHARILCDTVDMGAYESGIGDDDCDGDIDLDDFLGFQSCLVEFPPNCEALDFDGDGDLDPKQA